MSNYLRATRLYNTGFIPGDATQIRLRQGLAPQDVTNACAYVPVETDGAVRALSTRGLPNGAVCNQKNLYPAQQAQLSYGVPPVPDDCPCLDYIRAP